MENIKISDYNITIDDIVQYWIKLFPEVKSIAKFEKILENVSDSTISSLVEENDHVNSENTLKIENITNYDISCYLEKYSSKLDKYIPFYLFFKPLINAQIDDFINKIANIKIIEDIDIFVENIMEHILDQLFQVAYRVIILEINVARTEGRLQGKTSEERFIYFSNKLLQNKNYIHTMYNEYSTLIEILNTIIKNNFNYIIEIVTNTAKELDNINLKFNNGNSVGYIKKISTGLGDTHKGGKAVSTIYFSKNIKVVYKPRSLELEYGFQKLLQWVECKNIKGLFNFKKVKIHTINEAGWMEFIEYKECKNSKCGKEFYSRTGHILCLLYILNAVDFHYENLIAHGEYPILIDLESLFHGKLKTQDKEINSGFAKAKKIIDNSVQSISLLPTNISKKVGHEYVSIDIGGLSANKEQVAPFKSLIIENMNLDTIKVIKKDTIVKPQLNNPSINGEFLNSEKYLPEIKEGFEVLYNWVLDNKKEFSKIVKSIFGGMRSRIILKPTFFYAQLLGISSHPDFMRDFYHRKVLLHRIGIHSNDEYCQIMKSEFQDLLSWDIPFFNVSISETYIIDSRGVKYIDLLEKSPINLVEEKIIDLTKADLKRQIDFIEVSFLNKQNREQDITRIKFLETINVNKLKPEKWINVAAEIGEFILDNSFSGINSSNKKDRFWIGPSLDGFEESIWNSDVLGLDLYNGNTGIALFLGYLGAILNRSDFKQASFEAMEPVMTFIENMDKDYPYLVGAFNGISGYFYVLKKLAGIFKDDHLDRFILKHIEVLAHLSKKDEVYDVIGGSAGSLGVLLSIYNSTEDINDKNKILAVAKENYKHILGGVKESQLGVSWPTKFTPAYSGFSHGSAGYIAYMYKLYKLTGDNEIIHYINKALNFEEELYSDKYNNWFSTEHDYSISNGWCHGAPGILLSKAILKENGFENKDLDRKLSIAINSTWLNGIGNNPTYCHGDLGSLAILNYAANVTNNVDLKNKSYATFQQLFDDVLSNNWKKRESRCTKSYSLMIGICGFGYSMLKNYAPDFVPEFLWLE
ncbi:type 2 lanthipeptide synthetase LanM family protein [Clostridium frigidicarnis]|uniref:Type 2 lantibiotic biosynthesis protein LanM n=1 Tax=Clostridium frigidicarnis TaxID=84698 RepID=A0A1I1B5Z9_9CLOT|nr:type 2 lanthipeptide synthetase LanM family protein [Clostridium frigidicarnis]SFB45765.1 type 2 lantibiotic biosynthesis protein LanM [Clostridium frigidicarnis]